MDTTQITFLYISLVLAVITAYFYMSEKVILKDLIGILSGLTIALGLINYITIQNETNTKKDIDSKRNYIDNISSIFVKINSLYLEYPNELHNLFYEFYGFNSFPENSAVSVIQNTPKPTTDNQTINSMEFMVINIIVEYLSNMFIINPEIFNDLNTRNRIACFTQSKKFKKILSVIKNNYSQEFINSLNQEKIILISELDNQNVNIPKII